MLVIWNERAKPRCERAGAESAVMSSPAKRTRPRSGTRSPASWPISVVLPAPFGPMIACVSPSSTSRSTLSLASSAPKLLVRPRTSSRTLFILAEEQSREAALEEEHREHQQRTQDQLPVLGPARERVFDQEQRERAQHRSGDASDAPEFMNWTRSGELMFMVILGGIASITGPVLGAFALLLVEDALSGWTEHWQLILGPLLVLSVLFFKRGLAGLLFGKNE